jgi:hypothetical protein
MVVITLVWSSSEFTLQKLGLGLVAKFGFGMYSCEPKGSYRLRVLHLCAFGPLMCY